MATIGSINILLSASSSAITKAAKEVNSSLKDIGSTASSIKGMIAGAFALAGISVGLEALKGYVHGSMEAVDAAWKLSSALKMPTDVLMGFQQQALLEANMSTEDFNGALEKLVKNLGEAASAGGPPKQALEQLGLSAETLANGSVGDAFTQIAQKISEIKNPTEQAIAVTELFGKTGQKLLPMFAEGAEGIKQAHDAAVAAGAALTDLDAAKIIEAKEETEQLTQKFEGIKNELTLALAPVLTEILKKIQEFVPAADTMRNAFLTTFKYVAIGIGVIVDAWNVLKLGAQAVCWAIVGGLEVVIIAINKVAEGIIWVANKLGANWHLPEWMQNVEDTVDEWRKQIQNDMGDTVDALAHPRSEAYGKFFDDIQNKADETAQALVAKKDRFAAPLSEAFAEAGKKIHSILEQMQKELDEIGMSETDKKINELMKLHASQDQINQAAAIGRQIEARKELNKLMEEGKKLTDDVRTPVEKFQDFQQHLRAMFDAGAIGLQTYERAIDKAGEDLLKSHTHEEIKKVGADERRHEFTLPSEKAVKDPKTEIAQKALQEAKQQTRFLKDLRDKALQDATSLAVVGIPA